MNKTEKELKANREQLLVQLKECDDKLDAIKAERRRKAEIKRTYKPNYIEPEYEVRWEDYAKALERLLIELEIYVDESLQTRIDENMVTARKLNSFKVPIDPSRIWNCPNCGESSCLFVGDYGFDEYDRKYAVTCSQCDFIGPRISDYGEAWCEFEDWLRKKGYLKNEN